MRFRSIILAAIAGSGASAAAAQQTEIGYPKGSLALEAIATAEYGKAEAKLREESRIPRDDPARLINLGHVLLKKGRTADAARLFDQAWNGEDIELILADGQVMSSREVARRALQTVSMGGPATDER